MFIFSLSKCLINLISGCNEYYPYMSVIIASVAGVVYLAISDLMQKVKIDDPLDAVAVHGGPGKRCQLQ